MHHQLNTVLASIISFTDLKKTFLLFYSGVMLANDQIKPYFSRLAIAHTTTGL